MTSWAPICVIFWRQPLSRSFHLRPTQPSQLSVVRVYFSGPLSEQRSVWQQLVAVGLLVFVLGAHQRYRVFFQFITSLHYSRRTFPSSHLMASADGKSIDGDDPLDSPSHNPVQPPMNMQSVGYSMHMYPFPSHLLPTQPLRSKRRQVKNACTNCQKACKKCDDARPCLRCVKYGISEECVDSQRKERKKGIKRGPYKKRDGKGSSVEQSDVSPHQGMTVSNGVPHSPSGSPMVASYAEAWGKRAYLPPMQQPPGGSDGDQNSYPQQYYQAYVPFGPPPPVYPYMVPRHDGQVPSNYMVFPMYPKTVGGPSEMGHGHGSEDHDGVHDK
ncbi:hypothetical protein BDZ94DRAFT_1239121 [Collybia nuda]|uniref:Transcription activator of gluconeogenesis ERT1 n=1 Tax=Collybia nuda TaxID=64659 RepID=A0A9P5XZC5_9AGAR|nr:hypothetical protein BDZ94DRAFT_1239121 [Collybia nuda]